MSLWLKTDVQGNTLFRNDAVNSSSYRYGVFMYTASDGRLHFNVYEGFSSSTNRQSFFTNTGIHDDNQWHHYAVVLNSHIDGSIFWDGVELDTFLDTTASGSGMSYSSAPGALGHRYSGGTNRYYDGNLDDIRVYDRALSDQEIIALYKAPEPATLCLLGLGGVLAAKKRRS